MESPSQQPHSLEIWLHDVQAYIYRLTSGLMKDANFHFDRYQFCYTRKNKKSQDELSIIFLSQFPVRFRVGFQLEIWHPSVKQVKESFMHEILARESNLCSIILYMKDFPSDDPQVKIIKDYSVYDYKDLFALGDWLVRMLQYELIPLCDQLGTIEQMDYFFEEHPAWSLDTQSGGNICTDLIVAKLNRRRDYHQRYDQLLKGLQHRIHNQQINPESRELLSLCYDSLK
jgi:hypothetical protein